MPELRDNVKILFETINGNLRHQDYDHVTKIAEKYLTYSTGHGIEDMLVRFNSRETEELFKQRLALTIVNTMDILNSCVKPLYKVGRTPANIGITWSGKDARQSAENKKALNEAANRFWGNQSVEKYLTRRLPDKDKTDPNAFIVVEFKEQSRPDNEVKVKPYPFEVSSQQAINYVYKDNILQFLIVRNESLMLDEKDVLVFGEIIYSYFDNYNFKATQVHAKALTKFYINNPLVIVLDSTIDLNDLVEGQIYLFRTGNETDSEENRRAYKIEKFETNIGFVPAMRFGTMTDPVTNDRTCVPMIQAAESYLKDSIQTMSEFSITKRLHVFPKVFGYLPKCEGFPTKDYVIGCNKGTTPEGGTCKQCGGSGVAIHKSSADFVGIRMPDDPKDMVSLENMLVTKGPPMDLIKFQKEFGFDDLKRYALSAVYNNGTFGLKKLIKTATESEIDLDAVYDTLKSFADHYSECYKFIFECIASLRDVNKGLEITHQFPNDFGMEPLDYLLETLSKANSSGSASYVKKAINLKITKKVFIDQPREVLKVETKEKFYPFLGKTESEINYILANDLVSNFNKVFYSNFDLVFNELEREFSLKNIDFYELTEQVQLSAIQAKVKSIISLIQKENSDEIANAFGSGEVGNASEMEIESKSALRSSADGINSILAIQASVGTGVTSYDSGIAMLMTLFAYTDSEATELLGDPQSPPTQVKTTAPILN